MEDTLLGIDAYFGNTQMGKDLNEEDIVKLLEKHKKAHIILSPIGAQGFFLGRGNLQLSPSVLKKVGIDNITVVSTPSKLNNTPVLRVDTGSFDLDEQFKRKKYVKVITMYRTSKMVPLNV